MLPFDLTTKLKISILT